MTIPGVAGSGDATLPPAEVAAARPYAAPLRRARPAGRGALAHGGVATEVAQRCDPECFCETDHHVRPQPDRVWLSQIFRFHDRHLLAKAPSLVAHANRWRRRPLPDDGRVSFIPYECTINARSAGRGGP